MCALPIWCLCWQIIKTDENGECRDYESIREFFKRTGGSYYVGHNIIKYDAPNLVRLCGVSLSVNRCVDTLVLSTLYSPSLAGGHSLDAWGERMGISKIKFDDWDQLTDEMVVYCHRDVDITTNLFRRLIATLDKIEFSEQSIWIQDRKVGKECVSTCRSRW